MEAATPGSSSPLNNVGDLRDRQDWILRDLQPQDRDDVIALNKEAFPLEYADHWFTEVCSGRLISFGLFHRGFLTGLLVGEIKNVANCDLEDRDICDYVDVNVIYVMSLAVSKRYRRQGIASLLLAHLQDTRVTRPPFPGIIFLHVLSHNYGAIDFYETMGFKHHKTIMNYYMIDGVYHEGLTFVRYVNGHSAPCSLKDVCNTVITTISLPFRTLLRSILFRFQ